MPARPIARSASRRMALAVGAAALALAAAAGLWGMASGAGGPPPPPLSAERAQVAARRAEAAFADAQAFWVERFRTELARGYAPAELRLFSRTTETACAGREPATGPFYCAATGVAGADLALLDALGGRLRQDAQRGAAVFVARLAAAHAQAALGLGAGAEAGDCLVGVWAHHASPRVGAVSPDLYGRMLTSAREVAAEAATAGWRDPALFARGARSGRQAAYAQGFDAGSIAACAAA